MVKLPGRRLHRRLLTIIAILSLVTGCASPAAGWSQPSQTPTPEPSQAVESATSVPPTLTGPYLTPTTVQPRVWISPALPQKFLAQVRVPSAWKKVSDRESANLRLEIPSGEGSPEGGIQAQWIYALVAPFPTVEDEVNLDSIRETWAGNLKGSLGWKPLLVTPETRAVLESAWGASSSRGVRVVRPDELLETAWNEQPAWAIIPFEEISPRWKVMRVDGQSPLDQDIAGYPLVVPIILTGEAASASSISSSMTLPTNRDPVKLTTLIMTGVTALSRHIGERMEAKGVTYPARDIRAWLVEADLTHISNEVSFYQNCPKPGPERADMRFCSHPKYIELLEYAGADIIELTGNHNLDWGSQPFLDSLEMYRERGWNTYGGGANLDEAKKPLYIEHNGNRLVFVGCSPAGPPSVWADQDKPGSAPCNMAKLEEQIRKLRANGYLPVVTFQAFETDTYLPTPAQGTPDFRRMARAGAVIVSGSQSHVPQTMTFVESEADAPEAGAPEAGGSSFVHYGLGNLFFDQMKPPEARQQFIDRHVFYDGMYLGVELLTALLEDYSRPRPMKAAEREEFLQEIFSLSDWSGD